MPRGRGYPSSRRTRGRRTPTLWWNIQSVPLAVAIGAQAIFDLLPPGTIPVGVQAGVTILRMIGELQLTAQSADQDGFGAFGIALMSRDAVAASAVPDPIADLVDWYYHQNWFNNESRVGDFQEAGRTRFDIRTSRKVRGEDRTLAAVFENNAASAQAVKFSVTTRMLLSKS